MNNRFLILPLMILVLSCRPENPGRGIENSPLENNTSDKMAGASLSCRLDSLLLELRGIFGDSVIGSSSAFQETLTVAADLISSKSGDGKNPGAVIKSLASCIYDKWNVGFGRDPDKFDNILPHLVYSSHDGSCLGISLIYLLLGEKLGIHLYGVRAPGHFFVRYGTDNKYYDIETLHRGEVMSDGWYRMRYAIKDTVQYDLRDLNPGEVIAVVRYNIGNICLKRGMLRAAVAQYQGALDGMPDFTEARGNLAVALDSEGDTDGALKTFLKVKEIYPGFANIDKNIGAMRVKKGEFEKAVSEYKTALKTAPDDPEILYGLGVAYYNLKRYRDSRDVLQSAIRINPDMSEASRLLSQLR